MRYVTVRIAGEATTPFHPIARAVTEDPEVRRGPIHQFEDVGDGTGIAFGEVRGNLDRFRDLLEASPYVLEYTVSGEEQGYVYLRFEMDDPSRRMAEHRQDAEVMLDMPIEVTADGALRATFVGEEAALSEAFAETPEGVDFELLEMGEFEPESRHLFGQLTTRQQEILETAVRAGYYENPREATHEDVAAALDLSPGTVGEHLRKIESRVFARFLPDHRQGSAP